MTQTDEIDYTNPLLGIDKHFEHLPKKVLQADDNDPAEESAPAITTATPKTKNEKLEAINTARSIIRGEQTLSRKELVDLVDQLERLDQFAYATEVLMVRMHMDEKRGATITVNDYATLAKYIYKDHSLPSSFKFKKALQELTSHEDLTTTKRCETLGLAGAIYKRKWQFDHQFKNLVLAHYYYKKGYDQWVKFINEYRNNDIENAANDNGYNGINYAYINELMAVDELEEHGRITGISGSILERFQEARHTREFILAQLVDETPGVVKLLTSKTEPWVLATAAEAFFGLGKYKQAVLFITEYLRLQKDKPWEQRSFSQQLFSLAYLQNYVKNFNIKEQASSPELVAKLKEHKDRIDLNEIDRCLSLFKERDEQELFSITDGAKKHISNTDIKEEGKTGIGLSGGGFRASLFQIGVLAALAEKDELRNVEVISCVSGGSIIGAFYYLKVKALLERKADDQITAKDYIDIVKEVETEFLAGVQKNLRVRIFTNIISNFKMFRKDYSRSHRLGELYEEHFYKKQLNIVRSEEDIQNGKKQGEIYMSDLFIRPKGATANFSIAIDNWKRKNKVPQLVLNATSVNTGHNWQFTASWMGEPPGTIQTDIDVKPRLRRMYYEEAPEGYRNFRLGYAVAASSCVPVLFEPMPMPDLYPGIELQLIDGGVHDNQGIGALMEQECKNIFISDGSGQMETSNVATESSAALLFRSDTILQDRLRQMQFLDIKERNNTTQINKLFAVHLKSDLENRPVSWKFCTDPPRTIMYANVPNSDNDLTKYGILRKVQLSLSQIRTDLDSFSDAESYGLMYSGYMQVNYEYKRQQEEKGDDEYQPAPAVDWNFLKIKPYLTRPDKAAEKEKVFKEASRVPFKLFHLDKFLRASTIVLAGTTALFLVFILIKTWNPAYYEKIGRYIVSAVVFGLFIYVVGLFSRLLANVLNLKGILTRKLGFAFLLVASWIVTNIYIWFFNGWYNDYGKVHDSE